MFVSTIRSALHLTESPRCLMGGWIHESKQKKGALAIWIKSGFCMKPGAILYRRQRAEQVRRCVFRRHLMHPLFCSAEGKVLSRQFLLKKRRPHLRHTPSKSLNNLTSDWRNWILACTVKFVHHQYNLWFRTRGKVLGYKCFRNIFDYCQVFHSYP